MAVTQTQTITSTFFNKTSVKIMRTRLGAVTAPALDTSAFAPNGCTTRSLSNRSLWQSARRHWRL